MTTDTAQASTLRTEKLILARRVAAASRPPALETVARLHTAGEPVTFARVARTANVSTWFTTTTRRGRSRPRRPTRLGRARPSPDRASRRTSQRASLRIDLQHTSHENSTIKARTGQLEQAVRRDLGAKLDAVNSAETLDRLKTIEQQKTTLAEQLATSERHRRAVEDELSTARLTSMPPERPCDVQSGQFVAVADPRHV